LRTASTPGGLRAAIRVFAIPCLLAIAMAAGLISGLLGDGIWDTVSWTALGAPLAVAGYFIAYSFYDSRSVD
jgi:hypothetical protein